MTRPLAFLAIALTAAPLVCVASAAVTAWAFEAWWRRASGAED